MQSPFPGMDPYLEKYWHEVHQRLVIYAGDTLQGLLPPHLKARIQERVVVEQESDPLCSIYPDVYVVEHPQPLGAARGRVCRCAWRRDRCGLRFSTRPSRKVILISSMPIRETRSSRLSSFLPDKQAARRRSEAISSQATRGEAQRRESGRNRPHAKGAVDIGYSANKVPRSHRTTYRICVWRAAPPPILRCLSCPLWRPLPSIDIPLRPADSEVRLDLQPLVDRCYAIGRYDFDYRAVPILRWTPKTPSWPTNGCGARACGKCIRHGAPACGSCAALERHTECAGYVPKLPQRSKILLVPVRSERPSRAHGGYRCPSPLPICIAIATTASWTGRARSPAC